MIDEPAEPESLFSGVTLDDRPGRETESSYEHLNRAAGPLWTNTRTLIDRWFREFPKPRTDLAKRFQDPDAAQHVGAWWELYMYTLLRRLGYHVEVHPDVSGTPNHPDFLVCDGDQAFHLECMALLDSARDDVSSWIHECLNTVDNTDFLLSLDELHVGSRRPKKRAITRPVEEWLSGLNADVLLTMDTNSRRVPEHSFEFADSSVVLSAWPVRPTARGNCGRRVGSSSIQTPDRDETEAVRAALRKKGTRYGRRPDQPLVIALLGWSSWADDSTITDALFGSRGVSYMAHDPNSVRSYRFPNGYWKPTSPRSGKAVSAVLFADHSLKAYRPNADLPRLWINPWANRPLNPIRSLSYLSVSAVGALERVDSIDQDVPKVLDLPEYWCK